MTSIQLLLFYSVEEVPALLKYLKAASLLVWYVHVCMCLSQKNITINLESTTSSYKILDTYHHLFKRKKIYF